MAKGLIVDDSKFMRRIIREALESGNHEIIAEADNGYDGLESYKELKPDFVTMDITMGGKDGARTIKDIMEIDPDARIVVVSALNETVIRGIEKDVNPSAFITKPFDRSQLLDAIAKALAK
ncbi:MAG: response regulator [bacterium]|nr:response regulator [bacterium]